MEEEEEQGWFSVWAQPSPADEPAGLRPAMLQLRTRFQGPLFEPHVTVRGVQKEKVPLRDASKCLRAACRSLRPFTCRLTRVDCGQTFFQCVYMLVEPSQEVMEANKHVQNIFENPNSVEAVRLNEKNDIARERFRARQVAEELERVAIDDRDGGGMGEYPQEEEEEDQQQQQPPPPQGGMEEYPQEEEEEVVGGMEEYPQEEEEEEQQQQQPPPQDYMPHLSLLYGDLTPENKEKAKKLVEDECGLDLCNTQFRVSSLCLYSTDINDKLLASWRKIAEYPLEGGDSI